MSYRIGKTTYNSAIKKWSYSKLEKEFGNKAGSIATLFGIKKEVSKKKKPSEED